MVLVFEWSFDKYQQNNPLQEQRFDKFCLEKNRTGFYNSSYIQNHAYE